MQVSEFTIRRPITTVMLCASLVVLGAISLTRLPLEYAPSMSWPSMWISANYPSSAPGEVEREITLPIEEALSTLPGIESSASWSRHSGSRVRIEFAHGTDMDLMSVQVRDRLDRIQNRLPEDLERVEIRRWNTDDWPIMTYSLTWKGNDIEEIASVCEHIIVPRLQRIPGVGGVEIEGLRERVLMVELDQERMDAYNVDVRQLNRAIRQNNINISAGHIAEAGRRYAVRAVGEFETVDQIRRLPLSDGLTIGNVADVSYDFPERRSFERMDGRDAIQVEIRKASTANLVSTARSVRTEVEAILAEVGPDNLQMKLIRDQSEDVTQGIASLSQSAILGGLLAIAVIFFFLRNFRSTLIIGSAIPVSALCVFVIMYGMRQLVGSAITLNLVSMMGLMVAIGMLVDPAVVTLENIYRKRYSEGLSSTEAAISGAQEIGMPVVAAALTTICVFIPLIFVQNSGRSMWMRDFAVTVVISVIASVCVALTVVPMVGARAFTGKRHWVDRWLKIGMVGALLAGIAVVVNSMGIEAAVTKSVSGAHSLVAEAGSLPKGLWVFGGIGIVLALVGWRVLKRLSMKEVYGKVVNLTLRHRWTTVAGACALLALGFDVYSRVESRPNRWQPTRRADFSVEVPRSYDIVAADQLFRDLENLLMPLKEELDIESVMTRYGGRRHNRMVLYLTSMDDAKLSSDDVRKKVMAMLPKDIPGIKFTSGWRRNDSGVEVELHGRNPLVLDALAEDLGMMFEKLDGVQEVSSSLENGTEEIHASVNRLRAQRAGLSPEGIARSLATALGSRGASKFKTPDGEIDINVLLEESDRKTLDELKNTTFSGSRGQDVAFGTVAAFAYSKGPRTIERQDRMSTVEMRMTTDKDGSWEVGKAIKEKLEAYPMPNGYGFEMGRGFRRLESEQGQTNFTMLFAALLIYLIMAALFESFIHPFTIMFSIGFAFIGVAFGLYGLQVPMDSNGFYGLLILFGIVVNNGIVLVDHINRYRQRGLCRREAIILGGQDRLRPIAMTASTTILGLTPLVLPMLYGTAEGYAKRWGPIGLVVICGLTAATVLTLVLLPTIYSLMDDLSRYFKRVVAGAKVVS